MCGVVCRILKVQINLCIKMKLLHFLWTLAPVFAQHRDIAPLNMTSSPCADSEHLFLAPGVLSAGGTSRACVSRFHPDGPAQLQVTLLAADQLTTTASRELPPGDGGCIDIAVPLKPNTKAKLFVKVWYPEAQCSWTQEMVVRVGSGRVVVVQTERPRYRPGDTLRARVFALKADLTPVHGPVDEIWLEGPQGAWAGTRAAQWQKVRTKLGIAQIQHQIDELAPPGRWTLRAKLGDGSQGAAAFTVGNYEIPPFQLTVRHAPKVLRNSERLVWTVCVRYPWSEAVEGMLVIRIRSAGGRVAGAGAGAGAGGIRTAVRLRARACHRHAAAARRVQMRAAHRPDVVVADFSFQEDGTRVWQNITVVSQIVDNPISLEFLTKHRAVVSPRLPYKLKVKATRWDDKPAPNQRIRVCRTATKWPPNAETKWSPETWSQSNATCFEGDTDESGIARITFTASDDGNKYYTFQAMMHNDSSVTAPPLPATAADARAALGPLRVGAGGNARVPLYVALPAVSKPLSVHFVVITRGGNIYRWGATTQCPTTSSADYVPTTSRNSLCHDPYAPNLHDSPRHYSNSSDLYTNSINYDTRKNIVVDSAKFDTDRIKFDRNGEKIDSDSAKFDTLLENDPDSLLDRQLLRVMLPIKVTHQMCPDSHLIAYFYHDGELISASKHFEMDDCFNNKVEIGWTSRQVRPGGEAALHVTSGVAALCALSAIDAAAAAARPASGALRAAPVDALRRLAASRRNLTEYDAPHCHHSLEDTDFKLNGVEALEVWMSRAGVRVGSTKGTGHVNTKCNPPAPLVDETPLPRSDFSEAWLWRLVSVGGNSTASASDRAPHSVTRHEASAVCVTRAGLAAPRPAMLQVFREFFIHADSPRRLKRGDTAIVRYRIFNYLYEALSVEIQFKTDFRLKGPQSVERVCVGPRSSVARRAELAARALGAANVSVHAASVDDGRCSNATRDGVSDEVIIGITVDPEGVPEQEQKSILLCGKGSEESSQHEVSWAWPRVETVPGTEALTVWVAGDLTGPLLADADALVNLPRGCGEQNMARLATNLLAVTHLDPTSAAAAIAKEHVAKGFTRQLQYVHPSGGFSAFGSSDPSPSTWLTAFCLRYMHQAHQLLYPGVPTPPALERAERWLLSQQMENGCFRNAGQVFHRELKGGVEGGEAGSVSLTAYVLAALARSGAALSPRRAADAGRCLRALPPAAPAAAAGYARALRAYARAALRRYGYGLGTYTTNESNLWDKRFIDGFSEEEETRELTMLLKAARRAGDRVWWETGSLSSSVEATAYALLALSMRPSAPLTQLSPHLSPSPPVSPSPPSLSLLAADYGRAAARWLAEHRNAQGGFISTQDTLVALEALTAWSAAQPSPPANLTVTARSGALTGAAVVRPGDRVPELMAMGGGEQLHVSVEGAGCVLVQATRAYHAPTAPTARGAGLAVQVTVRTDGPFDCDANGTRCFCAALVQACVSWVGEFPVMALLEVWLPAASADAALLYRQLSPRDPLLRRIELSASGGRVTFYLSGDSAGLGGARSACYEVPAVGPRGRSAPARARVLDYYAPYRNHTQMYTIPEDCPPRISHEINNDFIASDNLFSKAKSLTDSEEIVITHEFSFEDIPEGVPLEDPIYDTLTRDEIGYLSRPDDITVNNKTDLNVTNAKSTKEDSENNHNTSENNIALIDSEIDDDFQAFNKSLVKENLVANTDTNIMKEKIYAENQNEDYKLNDDKNIIKSTNRTVCNYESINKTEFNTVNNNYTSNNSNLSVNNYNEVNKDQFENLYSEVNNADTNTDNVSLNNDGIFRNDVLPGYNEMPEIDNPSISNFHIIDTEVDLEVPAGVEGPIPSVVLPPPNFVLRPPTYLDTEIMPPTSVPYPRRKPNYYYSSLKRNHMHRRYTTPVG